MSQATSSNVINLDDRRPKVHEHMECLFCGTRHVMVHAVSHHLRYFPCPGCDEVASVPEWRVNLQ
jgi:transcription elongation factor Elf1